MNSEEKRMKRVTKRLISIILVIVMCMQVLPMSAFAALIANDPAYNEEILDALTDLVGSEDEAERYYALLDQYGLLDEDGNMSESWEIWMDGRQVTLDEITALLENGDYDPDKYILVDGTAVTLGNIKTILEIEEYLAYLQEKYYDGYDDGTPYFNRFVNVFDENMSAVMRSETFLFLTGKEVLVSMTEENGVLSFETKWETNVPSPRRSYAATWYCFRMICVVMMCIWLPKERSAKPMRPMRMHWMHKAVHII